MNDLISRRAAIDAISCDIIVIGIENAETVAKTIGMFVDRIKALPSVDVPDTNVGEWIDMSNGGAIRNPWWESGKCDQCGKYGSKTWNYCPHCGSRNREE